MKTKRINREKTELALREVLADVVVATVVELVDDPVEELVVELVEGWGVQSCSVQPTLNGKNFE